MYCFPFTLYQLWEKRTNDTCTVSPSHYTNCGKGEPIIHVLFPHHIIPSMERENQLYVHCFPITLYELWEGRTTYTRTVFPITLYKLWEGRTNNTCTVFPITLYQMWGGRTNNTCTVFPSHYTNYGKGKPTIHVLYSPSHYTDYGKGEPIINVLFPNHIILTIGSKNQQ